MQNTARRRDERFRTRIFRPLQRFYSGEHGSDIAHETCPLSNELISCVGIIAFTLLFLVTFNTNSEKYAKTVWGILPKENPKSRFDRKLHERCLQLAKEFQLTEREAQTLELLAQNKRPKEISNDTHLCAGNLHQARRSFARRAFKGDRERIAPIIDEIVAQAHMPSDRKAATHLSNNARLRNAR